MDSTPARAPASACSVAPTASLAPRDSRRAAAASSRRRRTSRQPSSTWATCSRSWTRSSTPSREPARPSSACSRSSCGMRRASRISRCARRSRSTTISSAPRGPTRSADCSTWGRCAPAGCVPTVSAMNETNFGTDFQMYGNVYWMDDGCARSASSSCAEPGALLGCRRHEPVRRHAGAAPAPGLRRHARSRPEHHHHAPSDNGWHYPTRSTIHRERLPDAPDRVRPGALPSIPGPDGNQQVIPSCTRTPRWCTRRTSMPPPSAMRSAPPGSQLCPWDRTGRAVTARICVGISPPRPAACVARVAAAFALRARHATARPHRPALPADARRFRRTPHEPGRGGVQQRRRVRGGGVCLADTVRRASSRAQLEYRLHLGGGATATAPYRPVVHRGRRLRAPLPGQSYSCGEGDALSRNDPSVRCTTRDDCPSCPAGGACARLCAPRRLNSSRRRARRRRDRRPVPRPRRGRAARRPDRVQAAEPDVRLNGPYGVTMRRANCCVDDWWPDPASISTLCSGGCPTDLTCNE